MVGPNKKMLGAKIGSEKQDDLAADESGSVQSGQGGMSVARNWRDLPFHRIPKRLDRKVPEAKGSNSLKCWKLGVGSFLEHAVSDQLFLRIDRAPHAVVEPSRKMLAEEYQTALAATRDGGVVDEE